MSIPFIDLKAQYARLEQKIRQRLNTVLAHGKFIMGPEVAELEARLAEFVGVKHAITCSSGTDALLMSLMAWGIGPGDAVFTTPFTFIATAEVIALLGATPIFVDIDPATYNIDPDRLSLAVSAVLKCDASIHPLPKTALDQPLRPTVVIPVDLFGLPCDYAAINATASRHDLLVLEDAAQGFGGSFSGKLACSLGHAGATSFFPAKPLGCFGDGGAILTDDDELARLLASIRVHGKGSDKYDNVRIGLNGRLDTIQAAVLLAKLDAFSAELDARDATAVRYGELLADVPDLVLPTVPKGCRSAWAQYTVSSPHRSIIMAKLREVGVPTMIYYPKPLHTQGAFSELCHAANDYPVSMASSASVFSLPMHPYLDESTISHIADAVRKAVA